MEFKKVLLILFIILIIIYFYSKKSKFGSATCPVIKKIDSSTLVNIINDISIKPIGCFTNIKDMVFTSCINPYSIIKIQDSGITIKNFDIINFVKGVINNGYDLYGNDILNKYRGTDYSNLSINEMAILGYLSGYKFMSICKGNLNDNLSTEYFFSYSPPMNSEISGDTKPDLPNYSLTPPLNGYTNENENASGKQISCGYPCLQNGNPQIVNGNQFMCGSQVFPTIKTPPRYAVYQIFEKN